jgi:UDP:flavonoid glycosyltransferase YjiC (YdhE family)
MDPARFVPELERDPRVALSERCHHAVEVLRSRYGLGNASPFSYVDGLSPLLNVYGEPAAYLTDAERRAFEPIAFYGSLPSVEELDGAGGRPVFAPDGGARRVYVSFGTVVWRYWPDEALAALRTIADALAARDDVQAVIGLGGAGVDEAGRRSLARPNVSVAVHVDQRQALREADAFVTHQGLNSTHEAAFHEVPMLSYPFFSDQPGLARRCHELGLAIPLTAEPLGALSEEDVQRGLDELAASEDAMRGRLKEARRWELETIAARGEVVDRIVGLSRLD